MVDMVKKLAEIAADKVVTSDELEDFKNIVDLFREMQGKFSELNLVYQREKFNIEVLEEGGFTTNGKET